MEPTLRGALTQVVAYGSICWSDVAHAGTFNAADATSAVDQAVEEIRGLITAELTKLLDMDGVAHEWNEAIEHALTVIEGMR